MGREPLAVGTHGKIGHSEGNGTHKVWCRFRDTDGKTRPVTASGPSRTKAEAKLQQKLAARIAPPPPPVGTREAPTVARLTTTSRVKDAAAKWIARVEQRRVGTTYDTYRRWLDSRVLPEFGDLLITEMTVPRLEDYFERLAVEPSSTGRPLSANSRRSIRKVCSGVLQIAVRHGVLKVNPVKQMDDIEDTGRKKKPRAYDAIRTLEFFAAIDLDRVAAQTNLNKILKALFFTGARIGETLALRWQDANLTDEKIVAYDTALDEEQVIPPRSVWFNGNVVPVTGKGVVRHSGKTSGSVGVVELPDAMVSMLLMLRPPNAAPEDPIFPSARGGWRHPNNVQTGIRRLRKRVDFPDFTSHIGRKTNGTALDASGQTARQIADQLRKASVRDVQETYMGRGLVNRQAAGLIDAFFRPSEH